MGMVTPAMDAVFVTEVKGEVEEQRELSPRRRSATQLNGTLGNLMSTLSAFDAGLVSGTDVFDQLVLTAAALQRAATEGIEIIEYDFPKEYMP